MNQSNILGPNTGEQKKFKVVLNTPQPVVPSQTQSSTTDAPLQYLYLLREREFVKSKELIFKIGRTRQSNDMRFKQYPKGSQLLFQMVCSDCYQCENKVKELFKTKYTPRPDIGREYFEGDYQQMMNDLINIIQSEIQTLRASDVNTQIKILCDNYDFETDDSDDPMNVVVNTYADYMRFSEIKHIVITEKVPTKERGHIKFADAMWRALTSEETLEGYLTRYCKEYIWVDIETGKEIPPGFIKPPHFKSYYIELSYNWPRIIDDICDKCYTEQPNYYNIKYHEYVVYVPNSRCSEYIFNANDFKLYDVPNDQIVRYSNGFDIVWGDFSQYDTKIIDFLMPHYVVDQTMLDDFKKLCRSIWVEPSKEPIVFYDYVNNYNSSYTLTDWLRYVVGSMNYYDDIIIYSQNYYAEKRQYNQAFKKRTPRCVVMDSDNEKKIEHFKSLGIKNIIVKIGKYNPKGELVETFIKDNFKVFVPHFGYKLDEPYSLDVEAHVDSLLDRRIRLSLHVFKWSLS